MSNTTKYIVGTVVVLVLAISIGLIASSLKKLEEQEVGLQYDTIQRKLANSAKTAGLHTGPPGFKFIIFPRVYETVSLTKLQCLNKDGITITLSIQFQYLADSNKLKAIILSYRDYDEYQNVIEEAGKEIIHSECSKYTVTEIQVNRLGFQNAVLGSLKAQLGKKLYARVRDVQVKSIERPYQYDAIVREKEAAKQNIDVVLEERPRVVTAAETKRDVAKTQANITLEKANTDARIMLTQANADAEGILNAYETEARTYAIIMRDQNLTVEGLLSYLSIRALQQTSSGSTYINMDAPAKTTFP